MPLDCPNTLYQAGVLAIGHGLRPASRAVCSRSEALPFALPFALPRRPYAEQLDCSGPGTGAHDTDVRAWTPIILPA